MAAANAPEENARERDGARRRALAAGRRPQDG